LLNAGAVVLVMNMRELVFDDGGFLAVGLWRLGVLSEKGSAEKRKKDEKSKEF